jgi:MoaA/NifB/PqqE/SkfB family radical SAM enzyme
MMMNTINIKNITLKILRTLRNPRMFFKIIVIAFKVFILRRRIVKQAAVAITYECPCKCLFCSANNVKDIGKEYLSVLEYEKLIDSFADIGTLSICFTGGEPLIHKDILKLVNHVRKRNMLCSIITSCANYSNELWESLKRAGVTTFYISVDGIGERHDRFRNVPGLFSKIEKAVKKCRELNIEFFFNGVVTNENIEDGSIYEIIEYCQDNEIIFMILHTSATGKYSDPKFLLTEKNLKEFENIRRMKNVFWEGDASLKKVGCPAGIEVVFVTAYGDIMPCPFIEVSFGNIRKSELSEIVNKMWSYDIFGNITPVCLMGADRRFYDKWIQPVNDAYSPLEIEKHPQVSCHEFLE